MVDRSCCCKRCLKLTLSRIFMDVWSWFCHWLLKLILSRTAEADIVPNDWSLKLILSRIVEADFVIDDWNWYFHGLLKLSLSWMVEAAIVMDDWSCHCHGWLAYHNECSVGLAALTGCCSSEGSLPHLQLHHPRHHSRKSRLCIRLRWRHGCSGSTQLRTIFPLLLQVAIHHAISHYTTPCRCV